VAVCMFVSFLSACKVYTWLRVVPGSELFALRTNLAWSDAGRALASGDPTNTCGLVAYVAASDGAGDAILLYHRTQLPVMIYAASTYCFVCTTYCFVCTLFFALSHKDSQTHLYMLITR